MPGSPTIVGDNTVVWGSAGVYGSGIITNGSKRMDGDTFEVKDNNGFVVAVIYYNDKNECEFEMIVQTSAPDLDRGDAITMCGVANCLVATTEELWEQEGVRKFRVTGTNFTGLTVA